MDKPKIFVTQPSMPDLAEFIKYLEKIWDSRVLTNGGEFHQKLESELSDYLGVNHISLFTNGTVALITCLKALDIYGEVITTPFSFVATSHSLMWNGIQPIFVDIDPITLNIDCTKIEAAITEKTSAILPVHCYGTPCNQEEIQKIAERYNLKVIYDAAHAFGVKNSKGNILKYGDFSILSFHATKVFNTFEGGAIVSPSAEVKKKIDNLRNFGFVDEVSVTDCGINGKMSEIHAAFGLLQLKGIDQAIAKRRDIDRFYRDSLVHIKGLSCLNQDPLLQLNYSYFPILVEPEYFLTRDQLYYILRNIEIYARSYFYPLISEFAIYKNRPSGNISNLPNAHTIAAKILCLPIYSDLNKSDLNFIIELLRNT
jgi:dTDP-4-amino-4,6-dideoxygalactose transaminase